MKTKLIVGSIIAVAILVLMSSSLGVIAFTSEETPFASSESSAVLGNLPRWEEEIRYYNPDTLIHNIGLQGCTPPCYFYSAIRLTQEEFAPYAGWNLTMVKVALSCDSEQKEVWAKLTIWGEGTSTQPGNIIYEDDTLYYNKTGFHIIELSTPIPLDDHDELWIGIKWEILGDGVYIPFTDDGPAVDGKGDWANLGSGWDELQNFGLDYNWGMGGIVEGEGKAELSIINIKGPIGVNAEIKNIGKVTAYNVKYTMIVTGGILGGINRTVSSTKTELAVGETESISSGLLLAFGPITITVTADAVNTYEVSTSKTGFIFGPFVFGIK